MCFSRHDCDRAKTDYINQVCLLTMNSILRLRRYSSISHPSFTSFFYHNARWISQPHPKTSLTRSTTISNSFKPIEALTPHRLVKIYVQLAKSRLTVLVVLTAMSSVALSPLPTTLPMLISTAVGTTLCAASANTLNQIQEVPFDAQMTRTRARPLVRRAISPMHATGFAIASGIAGPALLFTMVNPTTAYLGMANIALYAGLYTWMKRKSIYNTWVGAVVGGIPPLMGWTACGGKLLPSPAYGSVELFLPPFMVSDPSFPLDAVVDNALAPFALFMLLFSWQFPHFNSLSYLVRDSYAQAGYHMLSVFSPAKNALVSFRHTIILAACSLLFPLSGLTTWMFTLSAFIPNLIWVKATWQFWRRGGEKEARKVFQHSLWYLPVMLGLMMVHKKGVDWLEWCGLHKRAEIKEAEIGSG